MWRSFGGHSTWLVALTMATSKSFDQNYPKKNKTNITIIWKTILITGIRTHLEFAIDLCNANRGGVFESPISLSEASECTH